LGTISKLSHHLTEDARKLIEYALRGALPAELRFISGAVGMQVFSKLLYRFILPPPLPGVVTAGLGAVGLPLSRSELDELIAWLLAGKGANAVVAGRMRALGRVFVYLRDSVPATRNGAAYRCPVSWAHFLYPICMPSTLWVSFKPVEQAAILRALKVPDALEPTPAGRELAGRVQQLAPCVGDFLSSCKLWNFPEVSSWCTH
jgi:hypothetical protein